MTFLKSTIRTRLLFGTLLGVMTLGTAAPQASAAPIPSIIPGAEIINSVLSGRQQPLPPPMQINGNGGNGSNNDFSLCIVNCSPLPVQGVPGVPPQAQVPVPPGFPSGPIPPQARPPVPPQAPPSRPTNPSSPTLILPPIQF